jgi:hypothetical protein
MVEQEQRVQSLVTDAHLAEVRLPESVTGSLEPNTLRSLIFPRFGGRSDYAANAAICDLNSNSIGLT